MATSPKTLGVYATKRDLQGVTALVDSLAVALTKVVRAQPDVAAGSLSPPLMAGIAQAFVGELLDVRDELRAEVAVLRDDLGALRCVLAADDPPTLAALEALSVERSALDSLAADVPHLTQGEISQRLAAMRNRLSSLDGSIQ
jgi:hypothetical protein